MLCYLWHNLKTVAWLFLQYRNNNWRQQAYLLKSTPGIGCPIIHLTDWSFHRGGQGPSARPQPWTVHGPSAPCPGRWVPLAQTWTSPKWMRLLCACFHLYQPVVLSAGRMGRREGRLWCVQGQEILQSQLAAGRGCDSWWKGRRLGSDRSTIAENCAALANWEVYS